MSSSNQRCVHVVARDGFAAVPADLVHGPCPWCEIERLTVVATAAQALVRSVVKWPGLSPDIEVVSEPALTALESALAAAGYDMTDGEFCGRLTPAPESRDG